MGDIPDWLAQLAADNEEAPDELRRDVDASGTRDAMPDMSGALEDILSFEDTPIAEEPTAVLSAQNAEPDPLSFMEETSSDDDSWDSPLFSADTVFFDDDEEDTAAAEEAAQDVVMMDNLRDQAEAALPADLAQSAPGPMDQVNLIFSRTGLKSWQLTTLVVLFFLDVVVIGLLILTVLGVFQFG